MFGKGRSMASLKQAGLKEQSMHNCLIIIEKAEGNYSAYSPDLPCCIARSTDREVSDSPGFECTDSSGARQRLAHI
jgi:hypothetical protein